MADAGDFIPAAFPEVIAVSATTDWDGEPGGTAGCQFVFLLFDNYCDDALAQFSNFGTVVDVAAPGVQIFRPTPAAATRTRAGRAWLHPMSRASLRSCGRPTGH